MAYTNRDWPLAAAFLLVLVLGAALGAVQGSLVAWLKIPPFIVTLGGMLVFQGALLGVTGGVSTSPGRSYVYIGQRYVPAMLGWALAGAVAAWFLYRAARATGLKRLQWAGSAVLALVATGVMNAYEGIPMPVLLVLVLAAFFAGRRAPHALRPPPVRDRRQPRGGVLLRDRHRAAHRRRLHRDGAAVRGGGHRADRARGLGHLGRRAA